ncbi:MAG: hypothetical protein ACU0B7_14040 [Paracoccaceae bacterium]|uniref:hypothetical protein n=1 Tax=Seohaeicola saemankumensis TaxID=481181 RepID=UPI001E353F47|nr:hypothetical protein [Seohaeicola saemankumensis]MCD1627214.1 hypothetical protein [Seohaeicola saemankumensis]
MNRNEMLFFVNAGKGNFDVNLLREHECRKRICTPDDPNFGWAQRACPASTEISRASGEALWKSQKSIQIVNRLQMPSQHRNGGPVF